MIKAGGEWQVLMISPALSRKDLMSFPEVNIGAKVFGRIRGNIVIM
jgi:hypothetical protein